MKKHMRAITAFLLVALLAGMFAAPASAAQIFVNQETASSGADAPAAPTAPVLPKTETKTGSSLSGVPVYPRPEIPSYSAVGTGYLPFAMPGYYGLPGMPGLPVTTDFPSFPFWHRPQPNDILNFGKYYSCADAKSEIAKYLANNTYEISVLEGESRAYGAGIYMVSENPRIASFNVKTGMLRANSFGTTNLYVYTASGSPLACINCAVRSDLFGGQHSDILTASVDNWNPMINEKVFVTAKSNTGKTYNDIRYRIMLGHFNVILDETTGAVISCKEGLAVIRAYSKSNDAVYGDVLIFVGSMNAAVYDGYWKTCKDGIQVQKWGYDIRDIFTREPVSTCGWIRSQNGLFLPVLRLTNAEIIHRDGTHTIKTILTGGTLNYLDSLRTCYGTRDSLKNAIALYNASRYPNRFTFTSSLTSDESAVLFLAQMLGFIK